MWDKIFVINLEKETERLSLISKELNSLNFFFKRYEAIQDKDGAKGLMLTMQKLFTECRKKNYNHVLVFEDDATFITENVHEIINAAFYQLPDDYDVLQLGCNLLLPVTRYSANLLKIEGSYATHAIIYSKKGISRILQVLNETINLAYDQVLFTKIQPFGDSYCTYPMICTQRTGISKIFEYKPERQVGIEKYYNVETKEMNWGLMMEERYKEFTKNLIS